MSTKGTRRLTDIQFGDGAILAGTKIDDALGDAVNHLNAVPKRDVRTRFIPRTYHFSVTLADDDVDYTVFLNSTNAGGATYDNPYRAKGIPVTDATDGSQMWTIPLYFHRPTILADVMVSALVDANYTGTFDDSKPITANLSLDDEWATEDRTLNGVIYYRQSINASDKLSGRLDAVGSDMAPNTALTLSGRVIWSRHLAEPLPAGSRARLFIALPDLTKTPRSYRWQATITMLEEIHG